MNKLKNAKVIAQGKIFKIYNNDWGLKIIFNTLVKKKDSNDTEWKQIHFNVFKSTQEHLMNEVLLLPTQTFIEVEGLLYNTNIKCDEEQYIYKKSKFIGKDIDNGNN